MKRSYKLKLVFTCFACLVLPSALLPVLLRAIGHKVANDVRIGFSLIWVERIYMGADTRIGHFSFLSLRRLVLRRKAYIGHMNFFRGPLNVALAERSGIGNRNVVTRATRGVSYGAATLSLGELSKITAGHRIDCMNSVLISKYCTLAGVGTQIWTHGYVHTDCQRPERYRIDGRVRLGSNVNVGSRSIIVGGVSIGDGVMVGAGTTVSKSIAGPGVYVPGAQRLLPKPPDPKARTDLLPINAASALDTIYRKVDPLD